jgi:ankyrin repeat protein
MHAAYKGDKEAVDILLEAGADMDVLSLHGETSILLAAAGGRTSIIRTLLNAGCAPEPAWVSLTKNTAKKKESSPSPDEAKAEIGGADDRAVGLGWTPLILACQNGLVDAVQMLLKAHVSLEPKIPYRRTALAIARDMERWRSSNYWRNMLLAPRIRSRTR